MLQRRYINSNRMHSDNILQLSHNCHYLKSYRKIENRGCHYVHVYITRKTVEFHRSVHFNFPLWRFPSLHARKLISFLAASARHHVIAKWRPISSNHRSPYFPSLQPFPSGVIQFLARFQGEKRRFSPPGSHYLRSMPAARSFPHASFTCNSRLATARIDLA